MREKFYGVRAFGKFLCKLRYKGVWVGHPKHDGGREAYFHRKEKTWTPMIFITEAEIEHKHATDSDRGKGNVPKIEYYRENHPHRTYRVYVEGNYRLKRSKEFYCYTTCRSGGIPDRHNHRCSIAKIFNDYARGSQRIFNTEREEAKATRRRRELYKAKKTKNAENERELKELNDRLIHRSLIRKSTPTRETVNFFRSLVFGRLGA